MVAFCRRLDLRCETGQPESVADTPFITAAPGRLDSAIHGNSDSADSICRRLHVPRRHSESVPQPWGFLLRGWAARVASSTRHVRVRLSEWSGGHIRAARWSKRATVPPERSRAIIGARPIPTCRPESAFSRRSRAMRSWRGLCWNNRLTERGATEFCHQLAGIPQTRPKQTSAVSRLLRVRSRCRDSPRCPRGSSAAKHGLRCSCAHDGSTRVRFGAARLMETGSNCRNQAVTTNSASRWRLRPGHPLSKGGPFEAAPFDSEPFLESFTWFGG